MFVRVLSLVVLAWALSLNGFSMGRCVCLQAQFRFWTDFNKTRTISTGFHKKTPIPNFTKICAEGSALIYTDGRMEMTKLMFLSSR